MSLENSESLIEIYKKLKDDLGRQPAAKEFSKLSGISRRKLEGFFGNNAYSKLVTMAGDSPNPFLREKKSEDEMLVIWGNITRKLSKIPSQADWIYNKVSPGAEWYAKIFGTWKNVATEFNRRYNENTEWQDVVSIISSFITINESLVEENEVTKTVNYINENDFLPQIISNLDILGKSEGNSLEFEKKVGLLFQLLGFKVDFSLGQGTGRNPDGIAYALKQHYAIIYDAKARKDGYTLGTDDRQVIEYIKSHKNELTVKGFDRLYFAIVSNQIINTQISENFKRVFKETGVHLLLFETKALLLLLSKKIQFPIYFDLDIFETLLFTDGVVRDKQVQMIIEQVNKKSI